MASTATLALIDQATNNVASKYKSYLDQVKVRQDLWGIYQEYARQYKVHLQNGYYDGYQWAGNQMIAFEQEHGLPRNWDGTYAPELQTKADYEKALADLNELKNKALTETEKQAAADLLNQQLQQAQSQVEAQTAAGKPSQSQTGATVQTPEQLANAKANRRKLFVIGGIVAGVLVVIGLTIFFVKRSK